MDGKSAGGTMGEGIEEHSDGEGEDALSDAKGQTRQRAGQVLFQPHLAFQVGEDALDHQPSGCPGFRGQRQARQCSGL